MDTSVLSDNEVMLAARALSIHRSMLRKKLGRINRRDPEHQRTMDEIVDTTNLIHKLNQADLQRLGVA